MNHTLIREQRLHLDLTLRQVAEECGVSASTIHLLEIGEIKYEVPDYLYELCRVLEIDPEKLLERGEQ